jgi:hypothetical protein
MRHVHLGLADGAIAALDFEHIDAAPAEIAGDAQADGSAANNEYWCLDHDFPGGRFLGAK